MKGIRMKIVVIGLVLCFVITPLGNVIDVNGIIASAGTSLVWPVPNHKTLSQGYHDGNAIDISDGSIAGAEIVAAMGGTVKYKYTCTSQHYGSLHNCDGFGTGIVINGNDGRTYQYAHMQANSIPTNIYVGATVSAGKKIGCVGTTGNSTGNHLHFGISIGNFWNASGIDPSKENYVDNTASETLNISASEKYKTTDDITISWNSISGADKYGLSVWKPPYNGDENLVFDQFVYGNSHNIGKLPAGTYRCKMATWSNGKMGIKSNEIYFTVEDADTEPPQITNVQITELSNTGYTVICNVSDNISIDRVQFPTWSVLNDQDDIQTDWGTNEKARGTMNGNTVTYRVNICEHNDERGTYLTHIYAYDTSGNYVCYAVEAIKVPTPTDTPEITSKERIIVHVSGKSTIYYWSVNGNETVKPVTWPGVTMTNEGNGWYTFTIENATSSYVIFSESGNNRTADLTVKEGEWWYKDGKMYDYDVSVVPSTIPKPTAASKLAPTEGVTQKPRVTQKATITPKQDIKVTAPDKPSIKSLKNEKGKKIVIKLSKKVKGANGYQITYATNSKFTKSKKNVEMKSTSKTISKLKKGKTYYVKVRAYKKDSKGKKVYGKYSSVKKVKIKK